MTEIKCRNVDLLFDNQLLCGQPYHPIQYLIPQTFPVFERLTSKEDRLVNTNLGQ